MKSGREAARSVELRLFVPHCGRKALEDHAMPYHVKAEWDAEAGVWVATSEDVPGLVAEAGTLERLVDDLRAIIPDLLALNGVPHPTRIELTLTAERSEAIDLAA